MITGECPSGYWKNTDYDGKGTGVTACLQCHADCQECGGTESNQCLTCDASKGVLHVVRDATTGNLVEPELGECKALDETTGECFKLHVILQGRLGSHD